MIKKQSTKGTEYDLDFHIASLLIEEPFFARISRYISKYASYAVPIIGVMLNKSTMSYDMVYNPLFLASLKNEGNTNSIRALLMHEFYHIALGHCTSRKRDDVPHPIQNIAMDLAINSFPYIIDNIPDFACIPGKGLFAHLPIGKSFEWYLERLLEDKVLCQKTVSTLQDNHSGWSDSGEGECTCSEGECTCDHAVNGSAKKVADQKMKDVVSNSVQDADMESRRGNAKSWGSVSNEMRQAIRNTLVHRLDPETIFRYFCKTSIKANRRHRITKINKRWAYIHPGRSWERRAKIGIAVDESGSVGADMLEKIFSWMDALAKFCEFTVIPFDSEVFEDKVFIWKKGERRTQERVLCGGTDFDAPTDYVNNKTDLDALVIFTDLCAPKPKKCKVPRLWLTDQHCAAHPYFTPSEKVLIID